MLATATTTARTNTYLSQLLEKALVEVKKKNDLTLSATPPTAWEKRPEKKGVVKIDGIDNAMLVNFLISIYGPNNTAAGLDWGFRYSIGFTCMGVEFSWDTFQGWQAKDPETEQWENFVP